MAVIEHARGSGKATFATTSRPAAASARSGAAAARASSWTAYGYPTLARIIRALCTTIGWTYAPRDQGRVLAITSAVTGEGKSSLATAIAITMAQDHPCGVLLAECDLWRGSLAGALNLPAEPGLADILGGSIGWQGGGWPTRLPNLHVMPAGSRCENPSRLLRSPAMERFVETARRYYGFVILDLPALDQTSDAAVVARLAESTLLVVRAGSTDQRAVAGALQRLDGAHLLGAVLNCWRTAVPDVVTRMIGA